MISCILFDFDNTLYNYDLINKIALNKLFDELVLNNNCESYAANIEILMNYLGG